MSIIPSSRGPGELPSKGSDISKESDLTTTDKSTDGVAGKIFQNIPLQKSESDGLSSAVEKDLHANLARQALNQSHISLNQVVEPVKGSVPLKAHSIDNTANSPLPNILLKSDVESSVQETSTSKEKCCYIKREKLKKSHRWHNICGGDIVYLKETKGFYENSLRFMDNFERKLSDLAMYPILNTVVGGVKIVAGGLQAVIASLCVVVGVIPALFTGDWSFVKRAQLQVLHGLGNIAAGALEAIPLIGGWITLAIRDSRISPESRMGLNTGHEGKLFAYDELENIDSQFTGSGGDRQERMEIVFELIVNQKNIQEKDYKKGKELLFDLEKKLWLNPSGSVLSAEHAERGEKNKKGEPYKNKREYLIDVWGDVYRDNRKMIDELFKDVSH